MKNRIDVIVIIDDMNKIRGTIDITGYDDLADFIENDPSTHIKLTDNVFDGFDYNFLMLNKDRILGYTY